jgi:integrase
VSRAIDLYIKDRSSVLSPSTIADYERMPKHFEKLLLLDANDITSQDIQAIINDMAVTGLNARTIKNRVFFLVSALNYVGVDKKFKLRFPSQIKPNLAPPEPTEFKRLLEMATAEEKLTIILAGLYTLRRGEIAGLCGEDLLWDLNSIYLHTSRVQNDKKEWIRRDMPKNLNSVRVIQIDPEIMQLFPKVGPKEYVISLNPNEITKHFIRLRKKACVDCRFHDLRKYAASIRAEMMPSKYVEKAGGWRKGSTILSTIYDRPFKEKESEYSKKFNQAVIEEYGKELFN